MFARTKNLMLRPAWPEDAVALGVLMAADAHCPIADAPAWIAQTRSAHQPRFVIDLMTGGAAPRLIGLADLEGAEGLLWIAPDARGAGYGGEAAVVLNAMARHALPVRSLTGGTGVADHWLQRLAPGMDCIRAGGTLACGGEDDARMCLPIAA